MNQLCRVCGEPAAGFHFGAFTCEGCKSFFGRTYNNVSSLGECKNGGRCIINKKNRTSCKACRLRKCLVVGMSKSGSRYGRRSNWFKIHCLLQEKAACLERRSSTLVQEAKRVLQDLASSTKPFEEAKEEEDSGRESPSLSSPDSQASDTSMESINSILERRTPGPLQLYPKYGVLTPFLLQSPYPRLPFYPFFPLHVRKEPLVLPCVDPPRPRHALGTTTHAHGTPTDPHGTPTHAQPESLLKEEEEEEEASSEQEEPIDLTVRRASDSPDGARTPVDAHTPTEAHLTYSMRVTAAALSQGHRAKEPSPVDLSCSA